MKRALFFLTSIILSFTSCKNEVQEEPILGMGNLRSDMERTKDMAIPGTIPNDRLIELSKSKEMIPMSAQQARSLFDKINNNQPYPVDSLNLFRTAVYRLYSRVSVKDRQLISSVKTAKEIGLSEDLFKELEKGLEVLNKDLRKQDPVNEQLSDRDIENSIKEQLDQFPN